MAEKLWTLPELAEHLGLSPLTLYAWRAKHEGPSSIRVGSRVRYRDSDVEAYLAGLTDRAAVGGGDGGGEVGA